MTGIDDLEDQMNSDWGHGSDWDAKVARARERVAAFNAKPIAEQQAILRSPCDGTCQLPEMRQIALRAPAIDGGSSTSKEHS